MSNAYITETYGLSAGISSVNVRQVIEDKYHFLWISTQDGLNRFDGKSFVHFTTNHPNPKRSLLGSDCFDMCYDQSSNLLYVLSAYEGLNIIDANQFAVIKKMGVRDLIGSDQPSWLKKIMLHDSILIILTDKVLIQINQKTGLVSRVSYGSKDSAAYASLATFNNHMFLVYFSNGEMNYYRWTNPLTPYRTSRTFTENPIEVNGITSDSEHIYFSASPGTIVGNWGSDAYVLLGEKTSAKSFTDLRCKTNFVFPSKQDLIISNSNGLYKMGKSSNELVRIRSANRDEFDIETKNPYFITESSGNTWIGSFFGLTKISSGKAQFNRFFKSANDERVKIRHAYKLKSVNDTIVYIAAEDGLYQLNLNSKGIVQKVSGLITNCIEKMSDEELICSSIGSFKILRDNKLTDISKVYPELAPIQNDLMISMERINTGTILLASQNQTGLYIWNHYKHTLQKIDKATKPALSDLLVNNIVIENEQEALLVCETQVARLNLKANTIDVLFRKTDLGARDAGVFMDICENQSNYFIATYGLGLVVTDKQFKVVSIVSTAEGMNNIGVYKAFNFSDSMVAISTNNGLSIYNSKSKKLLNYFESDGLHGNAFEETSGCQKGDSIFLGGIGGITLFNTKNYQPTTTKPILYIDEISTIGLNEKRDTINYSMRYLSIPENVSQTKVSFVGINYDQPNRIRYKYRIAALQNQWIDLGAQDFIDLIALQPGEYKIEAIAYMQNGLESDPVFITLNFLPKWHQTNWFRLLLLLALIGLIYGLYQFRIRQLKKVLNVRRKISQDLHDDIGSTLSSISMYSQVARMQPQDSSHLENIETNTKEVLEKLDDIVWATNPKNDKIENLLERMEEYAQPLCRIAGINFSLQQTSTRLSEKIGEATRQTVFMVVKEAINNAIKYAACTQIELVIEQKRKTLRVIVADNGKGFDTQAQTNRNGIFNMQLRTKELKGKFVINSQIGKGTKVEFLFPMG
jgi:ligand-binding sensor domain-containing protein/signal transduction histidine kinase